MSDVASRTERLMSFVRLLSFWNSAVVVVGKQKLDLVSFVSIFVCPYLRAALMFLSIFPASI